VELMALGATRDDAREYVAKICLRIEPIKFCSVENRSQNRPAFRTTFAATEQRIFSAKCNLAAILPISGRMSSSIIAGIHCTGEARVVFRVSGAHQGMSCMWSCRPAL
jgi:hypothetical protein